MVVRACVCVCFVAGNGPVRWRIYVLSLCFAQAESSKTAVSIFTRPSITISRTHAFTKKCSSLSIVPLLVRRWHRVVVFSTAVVCSGVVAE